MNLSKREETILHAVIKRVEDKYSQVVDGIVVYGSHVTDSAHAMSDLDFYFIPSHDSNDAMIQFIYNDIGYDFWPVSWLRIERILSLEDDMVSLLSHSHMVYYKNEAVYKKFLSKQASAVSISNTSFDRAVDRHLTLAKAKFFDMYQDHDDKVSKVLNHLITALAYINHQTIVKSTSNLEEECETYTLIPSDFIERVNKITSSSYMVVHAELEKLISDVEKLFKRPSHGFDLNGFYEELKSSYNKVYKACDDEAYFKVYMTIAGICEEIEHVLDLDSHVLPKLSAVVRSKDYQMIKHHVSLHEQAFIKVLKQKQVTINYLETLDLL